MQFVYGNQIFACDCICSHRSEHTRAHININMLSSCKWNIINTIHYNRSKQQQQQQGILNTISIIFEHTKTIKQRRREIYSEKIGNSHRMFTFHSFNKQNKNKWKTQIIFLFIFLFFFSVKNIFILLCNLSKRNRLYSIVINSSILMQFSRCNAM